MRKYRWILYRSTHFREYYISEDGMTPFYKLQNLPHYIDSFTSYELALNEVRRLLESRIKRMQENLQRLKKNKPKEK